VTVPFLGQNGAEGVSNATVNRTLEVLRAILRKCVNEWEWLDKAPQVRMLTRLSGFALVLDVF
jgi:hypothetical protein